MPRDSSTPVNSALTTSSATSLLPSTAAMATLSVSQATCDRLCSAAALLRITPDALIRRLLCDYHNALGGLPTDIMLYIFSFLDYSTIASIVSAVSKRWVTVLQRDPAQQASSLRQVHGVHLLDPVRGIFYFPRALKRVQVGRDASGRAIGAGNKPPDTLAGGAGRGSASSAVPFSFLTVDIRTQDVRSLPWASVKHIVRQATEDEKMMYGMIRTPSLQKPENPVLMQSAMVTHDRLVYIFGGQTYEGIVVNRCFCYNPQTKRWRPLPPLREKRASATAVVSMGKAYVFGGYGEEEQVLDTYEVFDLATSTWERPPALSFLPHADSAYELSGRSDPSPSEATSFANTSAGTALGDPSVATPRPVEADAHGDAAVDPGPFRMPERLCGAAVVAYKDVLLFVGGFRQYIAPTDTAVHYSALSSVTSTPLHPNAAGGTRMVPSMSTSSMDAAGAAAFAEVVADEVAVLSRSAAAAARPRTTTTTTTTTITPTAHPAAATRTTPPPANSAATPPPPPPPPSSFDAPPASGAATAESDGSAPMATTLGHGDGAEAAPVTEGEDAGAQPAPLLPLPLPRRQSLTLDGPSSGETFVWVFSPRLQRWWLNGPPLPSPRAFGSAVILSFPGTLGTCLCYFGGCVSADQPETSMLYIPLREDDATITTATMVTPNRSHAAAAAPELACSHHTFLRAAEEPALRADRHVPGSAVVMRTYFRDPRRLLWHRYLRIPLGGAFTSVAVIGKESARSAVLSAFYPTPNIGACYVSKLLPAELCQRDEWRPRTTRAVASASTSSNDEEEGDEEMNAEAISAAEVATAHAATRLTTSSGQQSASSFSSPATDASSPALPGVLAGGDSYFHSAAAMDDGVGTPDDRAVRHLDPALLRVRGQGSTSTSGGPGPTTLSAEATPVRREQYRDVQQLLRTAVDAASQHRPRNPQTAGAEHQWHLAPLSEVKVRDDLTGRPLLNRVSWRVQALNAKPIVPIE